MRRVGAGMKGAKVWDKVSKPVAIVTPTRDKGARILQANIENIPSGHRRTFLSPTTQGFASSLKRFTQALQPLVRQQRVVVDPEIASRRCKCLFEPGMLPHPQRQGRFAFGAAGGETEADRLVVRERELHMHQTDIDLPGKQITSRKG